MQPLNQIRRKSLCGKTHTATEASLEVEEDTVGVDLDMDSKKVTMDVKGCDST